METVKCEYCGKTLPKNEATFYEDAGFYVCPECDEDLVTCDRCGDRIPYDEASLTPYGYLCNDCYDDLFD